jgi:oxygen-independent coproporphyrinogen-3 oxidase
MQKRTGRELAWGILTGIRPTKIPMKLQEEGKSTEESARIMRKTYLVSKQKSELASRIAQRERKLLSELDYENGYSLYVGIPFCPTICAYCSFSSYPLGVWAKRTDEYVDALLKEITYVAKRAKGKVLNTIYMGGGTPTTLRADQLDRVLTHLEQSFSYEHLKEITVEAGRPDSITEEKLDVLRAHGIGRISINPQTMQQKTLDAIGRYHTVDAVKEVFQMARNKGFDNINMDLIVGLPGETLEDVQDTLRQIGELDPDSITVHSLAVKRAAREKLKKVAAHVPEVPEATAAMIEAAQEKATALGHEPYYLYRQKNIAGNFENVGYAKVDKAGIYNILIMEEMQTIVAVGAGASTKVVFPDENRIERIENVKDVDQYINRIDEMIDRKGELLWR